jgi:acetyl esterase
MLATMTLARCLAALLAAAFLLFAGEIPPLERADYVVGFLRKGPHASAAEMPDFARIRAAGKLAEAGHFTDGGDVPAMFILKNTTLEEARKLLDADPAIKSGRLMVELRPWNAWAGLRVSPPKGFLEENDVEYSRPNGRPLTLDLRVPLRSSPSAAVIIVHGGGFARGTKRTYVTPLFDQLSAAGIGWFSIDYRLAPEFQLPQSTEDVANAIRWVRENAPKYHVDPEKIALAGESAGGFLVAYAGVKAKGPTRLRAVVDFYGPNDLVLQTEKRRADDPSEAPGLKEWLGFRSWKQPEVMEKLRVESPTSHIHKGMPPFLFIHGTGDEQVPYEQSPKMCELMKKAGVACEVITMERGRHGMGNWDQDPSMAHWRPEMIAWLRKTLGVTGN